MASIITSRASRGSASRALASISSVRSAWSSEPQLTPIRTGLSFSIATRTIVWKFSSWRLAPTLPGLIRYLARAARHLRVLDQELVAVVVEVADDRHADAEAAELADHLGHGGRGRVGVDRDPDELRAGVGQARDLDRGRVGVGGVGVRHRLDDDGMGAADEHAADVDGDGRPPPRPEAVGRGSWRARSAAEAADDVEAGDPDEEREQEHEADEVGEALGPQADPRAEEPLEDEHQHPAAIERRERQDVHDARGWPTGCPRGRASRAGPSCQKMSPIWRRDADRAGRRRRLGRVR